MAKVIFQNNPKIHVDIGSRIDGFIAHLAVFREVEIFDIRSLDYPIPNVKFVRADLTALPAQLHNYCDSISSLHVIEHIGLGRYGDSIDYYGHIKSLKSIHAILKKSGKFYFSTPIGPQRIEFNAHRVFNVGYLIKILTELFQIEKFHYIDDKGCFFENIPLQKDKIENNFGCHYGCGIFELIKI